MSFAVSRSFVTCTKAFRTNLISCHCAKTYKKTQNYRTLFINSQLLSGLVAPEQVSLNRKKLHLETENMFAHKALEDLPNYSNILVTQSQINELLKDEVSKEVVDEILKNTKWDNISLDEVCRLFCIVSIEANKVSFLPLSNSRYTDMCSSMVKRFNSMSDEQIETVLRYLTVWPLSESTRATNFVEFWRGIDEVCIQRRKNWDRNKIFRFIDLWHSLRLTRISNFVYTSVIYLAYKASTLTPTQTILLFYYLNAMRITHKAIKIYNLEHRLEEFSKDLSLNELGVSAMGFFKTQNLIRSEAFLAYLMHRVMNESKTVPDVMLTAFLKVFRNSLSIPLWSSLLDFLDVLEKEIPRLSLQSSVHLALVTARSQVFHPTSLSKVSQKLVDEISKARLKDLEKVMYPLTLLNYDPKTTPDVYETVLKELDSPEREKEMFLYPRTLVALLHYLSLRGFFHERLIAKVLDMDFIRNTYGKTNFAVSRELLSLDVSMELECPDYKGPRLPVELRNYLSKRYSTFLPDPKRKVSKHGELMLDLLQTLEQVLGKDYFTCKYIHPSNYRADVVLILDESGKPMPIPEEYSSIEDFTGPIRAGPNGNWKVLVIISKNMCSYNTRQPNGETLHKISHLKLLGYEPIMITVFDWPSVGPEKKMEFLSRKIFKF